MADMANEDRVSDSIHSEARGPHWVAWVDDANGKPRDSVVLVGENQKEAEERARRWAAKARG
jgi:hypothetical protein